MIRFLFRLLGLMLIALAFILFVYDGTRSIAGNKIFITQVGDVWSNVHQNSLLLLQPAIERHVAVWLWDPVALTVLTAPSWLVLAMIGALLILLGRKKKPLIGYARD
ncbi:MAG: hypothetical protein JWN71_3765 [Xanthobacteraceae bacterium]|jgi:hypothetical protein|nr:hypothetical protein [Xanthobacteraceae bacterium]